MEQNRESNVTGTRIGNTWNVNCSVPIRISIKFWNAIFTDPSRDPNRSGSISYHVLDRTNWIAIRGYCSELCDYGPSPF